jgi:hypothetical protein
LRDAHSEELAGVAHGLADACLGPLPARAAEPIERRFRRAGVLLDEIEPLDRHEELVVARVPKLEELLGRVRLRPDGNLAERDEHADAVIDVHDQVVDLEVAEVGEERARKRAAASGARRSSSKTSASANNCRPASGSRNPRDRTPVVTSTGRTWAMAASTTSDPAARASGNTGVAGTS